MIVFWINCDIIECGGVYGRVEEVWSLFAYGGRNLSSLLSYLEVSMIWDSVFGGRFFTTMILFCVLLMVRFVLGKFGVELPYYFFPVIIIFIFYLVSRFSIAVVSYGTSIENENKILGLKRRG